MKLFNTSWVPHVLKTKKRISDLFTNTCVDEIYKFIALCLYQIFYHKIKYLKVNVVIIIWPWNILIGFGFVLVSFYWEKIVFACMLLLNFFAFSLQTITVSVNHINAPYSCNRGNRAYFWTEINWGRSPYIHH